MNRAQRIAADGHTGIEPIEFYRPRDAWGCFSNFSRHPLALPHPFTGERTIYLTGEHRYQAMKATDAEAHDHVNAALTAYDAKERGGPRGIMLRDDWGERKYDLCYYVMCEVVITKALQNPTVGETLRRTVGRPIWEDSPVDDIWGIRYRNDYRGRNLLGEAWMYARAVLVR